MNIKKTNAFKPEKGFVLAMVIVVVTLISFAVIIVVGLVTQDIRISRANVARSIAHYGAEGGAFDALWRIGQNEYEGDYNFDFTHEDQVVPVDISVTKVEDRRYRVESRGEFQGKETTVIVDAIRRASGYPLDYSYFIDNWGWFHGNTVFNWGNMRSNGPMVFDDTEIIVQGDIYTHEYIEGFQNIRGNARNPHHRHEGVAKLSMPDVGNFEQNADFAHAEGGTLSARTPDGEQITINSAHGDGFGDKENIYLYGTYDDPIEIDGPVAVKGDVIIHGYITGQGTLYTGGNIYVAGNLEYKDPPNRSVPSNPGERYGWIENNIDKDLIAYAAAENIVFGDFTDSFWRNTVDKWMNDPLNKDSGGTLADFDFRAPFSYEFYEGLPEYIQDGEDFIPLIEQSDYKHISTTGSIDLLDGIFYTNNYLAGLIGFDTDSDVQIYGSLISGNDALLHGTHLQLNHDPRLPSRYADMYDIFEKLSLQLGLPATDAPFRIINWEIL